MAGSRLAVKEVKGRDGGLQTSVEGDGGGEQRSGDGSLRDGR